MKNWQRIRVLQSLSHLHEERLITFELLTQLLNAWDEREEEKSALQLTLDYEDAEDSVSIYEARNMVNSGQRRNEDQEQAELG